MDNIVPVGLIFTSIFIVFTMYYVLEFLLSENDKGKKKIILAIFFLFVLFPLAIVLSVLLRFTDSGYSFGIFKLFLLHKLTSCRLRGVLHQY